MFASNALVAWLFPVMSTLPIRCLHPEEAGGRMIPSSLLSISPDRDARFRPRNRCIHEGYASVALVPIQNNDRNFGLLQFNDRIKETFYPNHR